MAKVTNEIKKKIGNDILSETKLENIMYEYDYLPVETNEDDDILKFTNGRSQIWIDIFRDDSGGVLADNIRQVTKEKDVETRVEPFRTFEDLKAVLDYFYENKQYHHWLCGWLMTALGRRVDDTISLKWSDIYLSSGKFRERLTTLKEEKTGKIIGVVLSQFARDHITEYCKLKGVNPMDDYNEKIFKTGASAFRSALKKNALPAVGIDYPVSTHSFRKFFANMTYKLHPNDSDRLKIMQLMFGHSSEEITRRYIGDIDETKDRYGRDLSDYLSQSYKGVEYQVDDSPVITFKTSDLRTLVSCIYLKGKESSNENGADDIAIINDLISMAESMRIK